MLKLSSLERGKFKDSSCAGYTFDNATANKNNNKFCPYLRVDLLGMFQDADDIPHHLNAHVIENILHERYGNMYVHNRLSLCTGILST